MGWELFRESDKGNDFFVVVVLQEEEDLLDCCTFCLILYAYCIPPVYMGGTFLVD